MRQRGKALSLAACEFVCLFSKRRNGKQWNIVNKAYVEVVRRADLILYYIAYLDQSTWM